MDGECFQFVSVPELESDPLLTLWFYTVVIPNAVA